VIGDGVIGDGASSNEQWSNGEKEQRRKGEKVKDQNEQISKDHWIPGSPITKSRNHEMS